MTFSESAVTNLVAVVDRGELLLTWTGSSPWYQVYINHQLVLQTQATSCVLPMPQSLVRIDVGAIAASDLGTDFSSSLTSPPGAGQIVTLGWLGGTFEGDDIRGFHVYGSDVAGGSIDFVTILATVPAYAGQVLDGFGMGGFGQGGFGRAASTYSWSSGLLSAGVWSFGVKAFDSAGNEGSAVTTTATVAGPPREPAAFSDGTRLHKSYNATTKEITLTWNNPPP